MLKIERKEKIKTYLMSNSFANIKDLAVSMDVSTATIRRTLRELEEEGIVELTHGGVVLKESGHLYEQPYQVKTRDEQRREETDRSRGVHVHQAQRKYLSRFQFHRL